MKPLALFTLLLLTADAHAVFDRPDMLVDTIAFGSCARQDKPQPVWDAVAACEPDLFLFIGDNMYADLDRAQREITIQDVDTAYRQLAEQEAFHRFRQQVPILATWDDHDYGLNDAGAELSFRAESQARLLDFFDEAADSPRRQRPGVYGAYTFGPSGQRVQVILLDTRYFRSPLKEQEIEGRKHYVPDTDPTRTMLGDAQWAWLAEQLRQPADLRILATSIQFVAGEHRFEKWANFPHEQQRLVKLIRETGAAGVVFVSGDRHHMELSRLDTDTAYPLYDFTSSGLNESRDRVVDEPNAHRISPSARRVTNFGLIRIDWAQRTLTLEGRGEDNLVVMPAHTLRLDDLRP